MYLVSLINTCEPSDEKSHFTYVIVPISIWGKNRTILIFFFRCFHWIASHGRAWKVLHWVDKSNGRKETLSRYFIDFFHFHFLAHYSSCRLKGRRPLHSISFTRQSLIQLNLISPLCVLLCQTQSVLTSQIIITAICLRSFNYCILNRSSFLDLTLRSTDSNLSNRLKFDSFHSRFISFAIISSQFSITSIQYLVQML